MKHHKLTSTLASEPCSGAIRNQSYDGRQSSHLHWVRGLSHPILLHPIPCKNFADLLSSPTLMGSNAGQSIKDAGWQLRVIETILQNTYQIFDED